MTVMLKKWYRSKKYIVIMIIVIVFCLLYYTSLSENIPREPDLDITRQPMPDRSAVCNSVAGPDNPDKRDSVRQYIENKLQEALKEDKGTGCEIPKLDPFAAEVTQFDKDLPKVVCKGRDWVKCFLSECKVVPDILSTTKDITCTYRDIIYHSDNEYVLGPPTDVRDGGVYHLTRSDHVKIKCVGTHLHSILPSRWSGHSLGFRSTVAAPPPDRDDALDVLIFGFDSTSKNGFIRSMPKSYKYLTEELNGYVLDGYGILGDGTPAALFPILTGKNELELPDVRKKTKNGNTLDCMPFIFNQLKGDGYRTAYFEDMPWIGTFQYRFNGFLHQPADHYLRAFYLEESNRGKKWWRGSNSKYCIGDTPQYKLMMNITDQFFRLDGKKFCFTFIADITHDDINMISTADDDTVDFLKLFKEQGRLENTMLFVMGDHGPRYSKVRNTLQGKLEERLPLMVVVPAARLVRARPGVLEALRHNRAALTTPHDVHATLLDALRRPAPPPAYTVPGADLPRALSLLQPIPRNRSCSEAGIEPHWCACVRWSPVPPADPLHAAAPRALLQYINTLTEPKRASCVPRTLSAVHWVLRAHANSRVLSFIEAKDADGYVGKFGAKLKVNRENLQVKISVGPGEGIYEASLAYLRKEDKFLIESRDISRTNAYNDEPSCISATHPHLNKYCYCKK